MFSSMPISFDIFAILILAYYAISFRHAILMPHFAFDYAAFLHTPP
jgi:hypothetical protein